MANKIEQIINNERNMYKNIAPSIFKHNRPKTNSQNISDEYQFFSWFTYVCSAFSYALYIPFLIVLFKGQQNAENYANFILAIFAFALIETFVQWFSKWWFKSVHCGSYKKKIYLYLTIISSIISVLASGYCGMNGIFTADNSEIKIVTNSNDNSNKVREQYFQQIETNNKKIQSNSNLIESNNILIKSYSPIALMPKGKIQIDGLQEKNNKILEINNKLSDQNNELRKDLNKVSNINISYTNSSISSANNQQLIFGSIFIIIGLLAIVFINFGNNIIYKFHNLAHDDLKAGKILEIHENEIAGFYASEKEVKEIITTNENDTANLNNEQEFRSNTEKKILNVR